MKAGLIAGAAVALALGGCASLGLGVAKAYVGGEGAFDAAVVSVDVGIKTGTITGTKKAQAVALVDTGYGYVKAARVARLVGNTADVAANAAALTALVIQIQQLTAKGH